jgi:hypothetical protein
VSPRPPSAAPGALCIGPHTRRLFLDAVRSLAAAGRLPADTGSVNRAMRALDPRGDARRCAGGAMSEVVRVFEREGAVVLGPSRRPKYLWEIV